MQKEQQPSKWESLREAHNKMWKAYQIEGFSTTGRNSVCDWWIDELKIHLTALGEETENVFKENEETIDAFTGDGLVSPAMKNFGKIVLADTRTAISKVLEQHGVKIK